MLGGNLDHFSTMMVRMEKLKGNLFFRYVGAEDYDLKLRLLFEYKDPEIIFHIMDNPIVALRVHRQRMSYDPEVQKDWHWIE